MWQPVLLVVLLLPFVVCIPVQSISPLGETEEAQQIIEEDILQTQQLISQVQSSVDLGNAQNEEVESAQTEEIVEIDRDLRFDLLPSPSPILQKVKCSKFLEGSQHILEEDCEMPAPEIPCETPGNSTLCAKGETIPTLPLAELMPQVPTPKDSAIRVIYDDGQIEFVDFGVTRSYHALKSESIGKIIETIGAEFGVSRRYIQLIRSGGVDIRPSFRLEQLPNSQDIVVYLTCVPRQFTTQLIMLIPACEDIVVRNVTARVEIPAFFAVYQVTVLSTDTVAAVIIPTGFPVSKIENITYNGNVVTFDTSLEEIYFRNDSAFIIYPKEPCPSGTPSPSNTPSSSPTPSFVQPPVHKIKFKTGGAYDVFKLCTNSKGDPVELPDPASLGLDPSLVDPSIKCQDIPLVSNDIIEPPLSPPPTIENPPSNFRNPMTVPATILAIFKGRNFPVLVTPESKGIDIFDAVQRGTGESDKMYVGTFRNTTFTHYTPLKPIGLIDGDQVFVRNLV